MGNIKAWPHLTIVALVCAVLAGGAVALWIKHERRVEAEALPTAARIERVDGEVALNNSLYDSEAQWLQATPNTPVSVGDRLYTRDNSRTSLAFTGRNFARLEPNTSLDILSLSDRRTQLALREGSAIFDVGYLAPGDLFEVGTPYGAVDFQQPGLYQVGFDNNGGVLVSVLSGLAQVVGLGGSGQVGKGEMLTLLGQTAAQVILSRLQPDNAGYFVDDYYSYRYPERYDGRYSNYDAYLNDPYYYDPYRQYDGYQYASNMIPGLYDLDYYGDWVNLDDYGYTWRPRVDAGWAPYQQGYWTNDYPYGPTWVSSEPWGYAPYHYGRWIYSGNQWFWIPDSVNTRPLYSPALVAFVPMSQSNLIGWVPLAPGDPYAPRYYDTNWQSYYPYGTPVINQQIVNLYVPGAVTAVPVQDFSNVIDYRSLRKADRQMLAQSRPVFDPLTMGPLRNAFLNSAWGRGKKPLPPGIAKRIYGTQVITSVTPVVPVLHKDHKDLAKSFRVDSVPEKARNQQLKIRDERQVNRGFETDRRTLREVDTTRANRAAQQEAQRLQREQPRQNWKQEAAAQRAQSNQIRQQRLMQKEAIGRQQRETARQQNEARRLANQQAAWQRAQETQQAQRAQQIHQARIRQEQQSNSRKAQDAPGQVRRQAAPQQYVRQPVSRPAPPVQRVERPQASQKAERRALRVESPQPIQRQQQQNQPAQKTERRAFKVESPQPIQRQQQQNQPAQKAERRQEPPAQQAANPRGGKGKGRP